MGCPGGCPGSKSTGKSKSTTSKGMNGRSKAKVFSTSGISTYGKPRITFSAKNR